MATANTETNRNYNEVNHYLGISNELEIGSKEWYKAIKKAGYKFAYRWINSDTDWMYFATNNGRVYGTYEERIWAIHSVSQRSELFNF